MSNPAASAYLQKFDSNKNAQRFLLYPAALHMFRTLLSTKMRVFIHIHCFCTCSGICPQQNCTEFSFTAYCLCTCSGIWFHQWCRVFIHMLMLLPIFRNLIPTKMVSSLTKSSVELWKLKKYTQSKSWANPRFAPRILSAWTHHGHVYHNNIVLCPMCAVLNENMMLTYFPYFKKKISVAIDALNGIVVNINPACFKELSLSRYCNTKYPFSNTFQWFT